MTNLDIKHDVDKHLFFVKVKGGNAELKYDRHKDNYLVYKETVVPNESRKMGVGSALAKHALDFAKDRDLKIVPTCSFVESFIDEHEEYQEIVK